MSCALFRHECRMLIYIVETWMLYIYPYCLHTKVVHITFVFKQCMTFMFKTIRTHEITNFAWIWNKPTKHINL